MFERFTEEARDLVVRAVEHAIRLGHRYVGPEHILLAAVSTGQPPAKANKRAAVPGGQGRQVAEHVVRVDDVAVLLVDVE